MSDDAIQRYEQELMEDPKSRAFAPLAEAYRKAGRLEDAINVARTGLEIHPGYSAGLVVLGRALFEKGELDNAAEVLQSAVTDSPENYLGQKFLGKVLLEKGENAGALQAMEAANILSPEDEEVALILEDVRARAAAPVTMEYESDDAESLEKPQIVTYEQKPTTIDGVELPPLPSDRVEDGFNFSGGGTADPAEVAPAPSEGEPAAAWAKSHGLTDDEMEDGELSAALMEEEEVEQTMDIGSIDELGPEAAAFMQEGEGLFVESLEVSADAPPPGAGDDEGDFVIEVEDSSTSDGGSLPRSAPVLEQASAPDPQPGPASGPDPLPSPKPGQDPGAAAAKERTPDTGPLPERNSAGAREAVTDGTEQRPGYGQVSEPEPAVEAPFEGAPRPSPGPAAEPVFEAAPGTAPAEDTGSSEDLGALPGHRAGGAAPVNAPQPGSDLAAEPAHAPEAESAQGSTPAAGAAHTQTPAAEPADVKGERGDGFAPVQAPVTEGAAPPVAPEPGEDQFSTETLADLYAQQGLVEKAVGMYRQILEQDPGNEAVLIKLRALGEERKTSPAAEQTPPAAPAEPIQPGSDRGDTLKVLEDLLEKVERMKQK